MLHMKMLFCLKSEVLKTIANGNFSFSRTLTNCAQTKQLTCCGGSS